MNNRWWSWWGKVRATTNKTENWFSSATTMAMESTTKNWRRSLYTRKLVRKGYWESQFETIRFLVVYIEIFTVGKSQNSRDRIWNIIHKYTQTISIFMEFIQVIGLGRISQSAFLRILSILFFLKNSKKTDSKIKILHFLIYIITISLYNNELKIDHLKEQKIKKFLKKKAAGSCDKTTTTSSSTSTSTRAHIF